MSENPGPYMYVLSQRQLDDQFGEWLNSPQFIAAVEIAANAYHEDECVYGTALAALREAAEALASRWDGDVSQLIALSTNYDDGAAAQAAHCAAHLRAVTPVVPIDPKRQ